MRQILEYLQPLGDDRVVFFAFDVGDEAQPTGVVLVRRIIQTLTCGRQPGDTGCVLVHEVLVTQAFLRIAPAIRRRETTLSRGRARVAAYTSEIVASRQPIGPLTATRHAPTA